MCVCPDNLDLAFLESVEHERTGCHIFRLSGRGARVPIWSKVKQTRVRAHNTSASAQSPALLMVIAPNTGPTNSEPRKVGPAQNLNRTHLLNWVWAILLWILGGDMDQSVGSPRGGWRRWEREEGLVRALSSKESICSRITSAGSN